LSLRTALATPEGRSRYVRRLFATIADRYDLITVLLSAGQDRRWKRRLVAMAAPRPGERALDLACGTGDIAHAVAGCGALVVGLDITIRMVQLAVGKRRAGDGPRFLVGDMLTLPFPDASFDLVTVGYGLRNVPRLQPALMEIHRVLGPGGRVLSLDFDRPVNPFVRAAYLVHLTLVGSALGLVLHRDPDTYRYIPESIRRYPGAPGVATLMTALGFRDVRVVRLLGGLMAIHRASK
jgi:demethylmenaquinone methyltransferase/2-methoxy-6-polyprenyl-1,4-benzoquinol methylase